jgi:hypothetical protein
VNGVNVKFVSRLGFSFPSGSSVRLKLNMTAVGQCESALAATVLGYCSVAVVVGEYEQWPSPEIFLAGGGSCFGHCLTAVSLYTAMTLARVIYKD